MGENMIMFLVGIAYLLGALMLLGSTLGSFEPKMKMQPIKFRPRNK